MAKYVPSSELVVHLRNSRIKRWKQAECEAPNAKLVEPSEWSRQRNRCRKCVEIEARRASASQTR